MGCDIGDNPTFAEANEILLELSPNSSRLLNVSQNPCTLGVRSRNVPSLGVLGQAISPQREAP